MHVPRFRFHGLHLHYPDSTISVQSVEKKIARMPNGQFATAHFPYQTELAEMLRRQAIKVVFVVRDPRDIVVSHSKYVVNLKRHFLFDRYNRELKNDHGRLMASIRGLSEEDGLRGLADIGSRLRQFIGWIDSPSVLVCRFEKLIGPSGGGTRSEQLREIESILEFVDRRVCQGELEKLADRIWSPRSATFRKGQINDWMNHFLPEHKDAFKKLAGQELIRLGYEQDLNW